MKKLIQQILKTKVAQAILIELLNGLFQDFAKQTSMRPDEYTILQVLRNYLIRRIKGDEE